MKDDNTLYTSRIINIVNKITLNITMNEIYKSLIRHALTVLGGAIVTKGYIDASGMEEIIGSVMAIVGVVWSVYKNKK